MFYFFIGNAYGLCFLVCFGDGVGVGKRLLLGLGLLDGVGERLLLGLGQCERVGNGVRAGLVTGLPQKVDEVYADGTDTDDT